MTHNPRVDPFDTHMYGLPMNYPQIPVVSSFSGSVVSVIKMCFILYGYFFIAFIVETSQQEHCCVIYYAFTYSLFFLLGACLIAP